MNERIYELFEQALKEFKQEHEYATYIVPDPIKEKFAELIVRECARVARATPAPNFHEDLKQQLGHTWDMSAVESGREIINHFGVEE